MIKKLTKNELNIIGENNGLTLYLRSLVEGKPSTPRSWLYENKDPDDILSEWMERLDSLSAGTAFEKNVFQFDTSQLEKWGPQGEVAPISEIMDSIVLPTYSMAASPPPKAFESKDWRDGTARFIGNIHRRVQKAINPVAYQSVVDDMRARDVLESNSGWPLFTRRNKPDVIKQSIAEAENGRWETYPAIALFRNYNQKTRLVWMYPMSANLVEGSFLQPVQTALIAGNLNFFAPWHGFDRVRALITREYEAKKVVCATDFSETDAHFTAHASLEAMGVVLGVTRWLNSALVEALAHSVARMHVIPLIVGPNSKIVGQHGMPSGSNWTNFLETIFDGQFSFYVAGKTENQYRGLYAIGDDMAWTLDRFDDAFPRSMEALAKDVGQLTNASKVSCEPDRVKTLQRLFQRGYKRRDGMLRGVYSTIRALKSSVYPEKYHSPKSWNSDMFCARQYMILENCVDHPLFEEFVDFVVHGQKDLIPFAKKSKSDLNRIHRESRLLPGLNPTYNQEKRDSSLANFRAIEIAKKF